MDFLVHDPTTPDEIREFFRASGRRVLTLLGFSSSGYERPDEVLVAVELLLRRHDPVTTIVNGGATIDGIGAAYEVAKRRSFLTTGIVSSRAREAHAPISPFVDRVFVVEDDTWGGAIGDDGRLSPTSRLMVDVSDEIAAFGGGDIARDELREARRLGRPVTFVPADMQHALAIAAARKAGHPPPTDFRGSVHAEVD